MDEVQPRVIESSKFSQIKFSGKSVPAFFPTLRAAMLAGVTIAGVLSLAGFPARANAQAATDPTQTTTPAATPSTAPPDGTITATPSQYKRGKKKTDADDDKTKDAKVIPSKDTKKAIKKNTKADSLIGVDAKLPDKQLYDKAVIAMNKGHFDVARLDLQTMLNTYPDSPYLMRAKLAVADSWYKEGGSASLTQAESEYADFRVFFPNAPEAAEAQMRIGDIYFRQMDKPDRDYAKALHAEEEYRRMLTDYPNAPAELTAQAKQRLREVQEVMATREASIANYYQAKENWAAAIARYRTVIETYPLYSHMDDALIGLGDSYEAQSRFWRNQKFTQTSALAEAGRAKMVEHFDKLASDAYRQVVLEHYASAHVEDARDRLAAMNLPIPEPSKDQIAASVALENSRSNYTISNKLELLILHKPDTVLAAGNGDPSLSDPKPVVAPDVIKAQQGEIATNFTAAPLAAPGGSAPAPTPAVDAAVPAAATPGPAPATPLAFSDVGTDAAPTGAPADLTAAPIRPSSGGVNGGSVSIEVVQPNAAPANGPAVTSPAATSAPAVSNGLKAVGPPNSDPLPAVEKPLAAPDRPNQIDGPTTPGQVVAPGAKAPKPAFDKADESSSKHKKKKGIKKLDPIPHL